MHIVRAKCLVGRQASGTRVLDYLSVSHQSQAFIIRQSQNNYHCLYWAYYWHSCMSIDLKVVLNFLDVLLSETIVLYCYFTLPPMMSFDLNYSLILTVEDLGK